MVPNASRFTRFLAEEEEVLIGYKFGVYDLLVLPPAFPYGGMVRTVYAMMRCDAHVHAARKMLA